MTPTQQSINKRINYKYPSDICLSKYKSDIEN